MKAKDPSPIKLSKALQLREAFYKAFPALKQRWESPKFREIETRFLQKQKEAVELSGEDLLIITQALKLRVCVMMKTEQETEMYKKTVALKARIKKALLERGYQNAN